MGIGSTDGVTGCIELRVRETGAWDTVGDGISSVVTTSMEVMGSMNALCQIEFHFLEAFGIESSCYWDDECVV